MSMLSDKEILDYRKQGDIVITPFDRESLGSNSYDLHLGSELLIYTSEILDAKKENTTDTESIPSTGYVLQPGILYLAATQEYTSTENLVPLVEGKSSMARLGVSVVSNGGFGDIGFRGHWTLELAVVQPVRIYAGMPACQICYVKTGECLVPYDKKETARYSDYTGPQAFRPEVSRVSNRSSAGGQKNHE